MFETPRLILREWRESDEDSVLAAFNTHSVMLTGKAMFAAQRLPKDLSGKSGRYPVLQARSLKLKKQPRLTLNYLSRQENRKARTIKGNLRRKKPTARAADAYRRSSRGKVMHSCGRSSNIKHRGGLAAGRWGGEWEGDCMGGSFQGRTSAQQVATSPCSSRDRAPQHVAGATRSLSIDDKFREFWSKLVKNCLMMVVAEEKETGKYVGNTSLRGVDPKNRDADVGLMIDQEFQGKGYGTEIMKWLVEYAFKGLGLHRLSLSVYGNNPAGIALYKKTGFIQEGVKREALWIDGGWVDEIEMGIVDREFWAAQKAAIP
ncbi:acyl-CoA N-acyltransferase [Dentipellis sp. KUC8613]|nr:acyl-CoA N-acyltransferase [Dentipellis sp. KUC8613]